MYPVNPYIYQNNLASKLLDGNTLAWYSFADSAITIDGSNRISSISDLSGSGNHVTQATDTKKPLKTATGILFDGVNDFLACQFSSKSQPICVYILYVQKRTPGASDVEGIFDGYGSGEMLSWWRSNSYDIGRSFNAGAYMNASQMRVINNGIYCMVAKFNGTNSSARDIIYIKTTGGDTGTSSITGITIGMQGGGTLKPANIELKEMIVRNYNDSAEYSFFVLSKMCTKYGITVPNQGI